MRRIFKFAISASANRFKCLDGLRLKIFPRILITLVYVHSHYHTHYLLSKYENTQTPIYYILLSKIQNIFMNRLISSIIIKLMSLCLFFHFYFTTCFSVLLTLFDNTLQRIQRRSFLAFEFHLMTPRPLFI
jgi:hypothetical protein